MYNRPKFSSDSLKMPDMLKDVVTDRCVLGLPLRKSRTKNLVIFDIDGCILDPSERIHHYLAGDYETYDRLYYTDKPIESGVRTYSLFLDNPSFRCLFVTSRSNACRTYTLKQLQSTFRGKAATPILDMQLLMRPKFATKDYISDRDFKPWLIERAGFHLDEILLAFDDRDHVVEGYRARGIVCYQTAPNDF